MIDRLDPLAAGSSIEASYKRYLKTLVAPRDEHLAAAFEAAVDSAEMLTQGPMLEITPPYAPGAALSVLVEERVLCESFRELDGPALPLSRPLYSHQENAIRKVVGGRNLVVSTGTGSGKTESFLLPILDALLREREAGALGPGVRALLLYPMNALANDQLKRLRSLLAQMPDITFGRYTGETRELAAEADALFREANPGIDPLPNELLSRQEMRENPPHILLTNYAMLEYLLLRPADLDLFDGDHAGTWRFIVLDEAHVYDGAQGAEVALLLRRLRERVARGNELQCVATSASLTGSTPEQQGPEATAFARHLFDVPFEFVAGDPSRQDLVTAVRQHRSAEPTWSLGDDELVELAVPDTDTDTAEALARRVPGRDAADALYEESHIVELRALLATGPADARSIESHFWPGDPHAGRKLEALVELGSRVCDDAGVPVLSARYHMFVRATEGVYVSFADAGPRVFLSRHEVDPDTGRAVFEFGTCQRCGAVHLAGDVVSMAGRTFFRPAKNDHAVRWVVLTESTDSDVVDEDELVLSAGDAAAGQTGFSYLCTGCGAIGDNRACAGECPGGAVLRVRQHDKKSAVMSRCTECGALARQVIRRLRTDVNAAPAVLTTALYQHLPAAADERRMEVGEGRKLLMFSDSRQAAAFAAPYLEQTYGRLLQRRLITQALMDPKHAGEDVSPEDLAAYTKKMADAADYFPEKATGLERSRTVNPWIMAELMAMDQRQSLEGLGLMKVTLFRSRQTELPRGFMQLGLDEEEVWALFEELLKTVRLQAGMTLLDDVDIKNEIFEPRTTTVRVRSRDSDSKNHVMSWLPAGRAGNTNKRVGLVSRVLEAVGSSVPAEKVLEACWKFLLDNKYLVSSRTKLDGAVYQIDHTMLRIRSGEVMRWYECSACRQLTSNNVRGLCPQAHCDGNLNPFTVPAPETDSNHYRVLYRTMRAVPMSSEEHTAQWAASRAAEIQRDFIEGRVNILSCSTTFELGVDVGDLQSVMLRNMPPKTANYVQRAGRAGRRADSAALVLTYAKRSSHDLSKFQQPESMIAGAMRIPWVPIDNERIARRHIHSVALSAYFRHRVEADGATWKHAGEFFTASGGAEESAAAEVQRFLTPVPDRIRRAITEVLTPQVATAIGADDDSWVAKLADLLAAAETELRDDVETFRGLIQDAASSEAYRLADSLKKTLRTIEQRQLLGYLANKNILPKYGFPVDTVELRTLHCEGDLGRRLELQRDLTQAIVDYAPGSQVVAGGKLWTSRGLRKVPKRELPKRKFRTCRTCDHYESGIQLDQAATCPSCGGDFHATRTLVVPEFGFVADTRVEDVKPQPPERTWGRKSYVESIGEVTDTFSWTSTGEITVQARAGVRAVMVALADGNGGGFQLCEWCGWGEPIKGKPSRKAHNHPATGRPCSGFMSTVTLAHRYETDVAEFTFGELKYRGETEDHWLSALYALLEGASEALEISRDDVDGTLSWSADGKRSIVLFDTVPAGAGAAKRIAEHLEMVIEQAAARVKSCECGPETSCYGCLRSFKNSRVHDRLSRNGAMAVFSDLRVSGMPRRPWGEEIVGASGTVVELLTQLAFNNAPRPQIGIELGKDLWPVEAVWLDKRVVLVDDADDECDTALADEGFQVFHAGKVDVRELVRAVA